MPATEHDTLSYSTTSPPIAKSQERGSVKSPHLPTPCCSNISDTYTQYVVPPPPPPLQPQPQPSSTQMIISRTYSPVPGVQENTAPMYSSPPYQRHPRPVMIQSPPYIHSTIGSPTSPSIASMYSNQHPTPSSSASPQPTSRTVYLGHMTPDTKVSDVLDQVRSGMIETTRLLLDKNCLFLTFVDASAAIHFYYQVANRPLIINGVELKVGWGKPSTLSSNTRLSLQNGASRNVFLGSLDDSVTEDKIYQDLEQFGTIEHVRLIRDKHIAFVHFLSITNAIKCVNGLSGDLDWNSCRISYGKDRCCPSNNNTTMYTDPALLSSPTLSPPTYQWQPHYQVIHLPPPLQQHTYQIHYSSYDPYTGTTTETFSTPPPPQPQPHTFLHPHNTNDHSLHTSPPYAYSLSSDTDNSLTGMANRTIYFGNIHPDATCEDICNAIRGGGILAKIRYLVDKHIAFITFVDPDLALHFCTTTNETGGIILKGRRLKLGWGKPSSLPGHVIQAIQNGGSRNVYLGNIHPHMTKDKLKQDFAEYGDIELVNCLKEKNCAFVNFTSIAAAIRAMDGIRTKEEYQGVRINYGKDRCGNPPKFMHQRKQHSETTPATTTATTATMPSLSSTLTLSSSSSSSSASSSSNGIVTPTTSDRSDQLAPHPSANVI